MKRKIDPVGKKYGRLLVLEEFSVPIQSSQKYRATLLKLKCQCDCGNIIETYKTNVIYGKSTQCCYCQNSKIEIGSKIGALSVISRDITHKKTKYLCRCECGDMDLYSSRYLLDSKKLRCKKCSARPKKITVSRKEALAATNLLKHLKAKERWTGRKHGRLKIISFSHWEEGKSRRRAFYKAICKCGNEVIVRHPDVKSCGCLHKESVPRGEDNHSATLTNKKAAAIREFKKSNAGYTGRQLAEMFGVSENVICHVLNGVTYKEKS